MTASSSTPATWAALAAVGGPQAAKILCRQLAGALDAELLRLARLAAAGDEAAARTGAARLGRAARVGLRLTQPWRVVVAGRVNAGKSSLVNAIAGHARAEGFVTIGFGPCTGVVVG